MSTTSKSPNLLIEVCIDSVESALAAVRGGADRLELCGNLNIGGGITPSLGLFIAVQKAVPRIPIMVMIRPRTGDFLYSEYEIEVMIEDILTFKKQGAQGVVFGVLDEAGKVDVAQTQRLVTQALPLEVCFHRAFDMTVSSTEAWSNVCDIKGITRILTSGHGKTATCADALEELRLLIQTSSSSEGRTPIKLCPGSGINASTLPVLCKALLPYRLDEIHLSGGEWAESAMRWRPQDMGMGTGGNGDWGIWRTSEEAIRAVRTVADTIYTNLGSAQG
ncbi:copper homeostasis CutC domain-containing protein [Hygrophoropsis aurantiaca]|uniref:Copper homeostasis CutC domain-containing protein n=1 Tax=Hygrophoropsis aurantiaca TaxID=72124 RepID=A0ACB8AS84_9AGAM|nr:copper homeostasis CutC domain-containing protein [Hygrophoropsis aurantiaca]